METQNLETQNNIEIFPYLFVTHLFTHLTTLSLSMKMANFLWVQSLCAIFFIAEF